MKSLRVLRRQAGFTSVELILACVVFPIIVIGLANAFQVVQKSYSTSRELNEMYAVLSACPEIDRALEFNALSSSTNCFPNNSFVSEGGGSSVITYTPTLTVTNTPSLPSGDPLKTIPDSKVVDISVSFQHSSATPLRLRMLITRNGVGQQ
jgi:hypothetical protein